MNHIILDKTGAKIGVLLLLSVTGACIGRTSSDANDGTSVTVFERSERPKAPDFSVRFPNGDSGRITIADFKGKLLILAFFRTTCVPCMKELKWIEQHRTERSWGNASVLGVCLDSLNDARSFTDARIPTVFAKEDIGVVFGGTTMVPTTLIIDREGRIATAMIGPRAPNALMSSVVHLAAE